MRQLEDIAAEFYKTYDELAPWFLAEPALSDEQRELLDAVLRILLARGVLR